jgi:SAM-dependent methyltransferase
MAAMARQTTGGQTTGGQTTGGQTTGGPAAAADVEVVESDFEHFDPGEERFPLLYSAQAWHWVDPAVGYAHARHLLTPEGLLAVFWNRPAWGRSPLRDALVQAYARIAPAMDIDTPMHPANPRPDGDEDWMTEIAGVPEFTDPTQRVYRWSLDYSASDYAGLMGTLSEFRLLDPDTRERLLAAIRDVIDAHGGTFALPMATLLNTARAAQSSSA